MKNSLCFAASAMLGITSIATGDGYLWLGAEYVGEGNVYRYNIDTGVVDHFATPGIGSSDHLNNCATDGDFLYVGSPTSNLMGVCDLYSGALLNTLTYSASLAGHKEDGASRASTGTLWRSTFSGLRLHEVEPDGTVVASYVLDTGGLVGLVWVNEELYATSYTNGTIGTIEIAGGNASYSEIPWATGAEPPTVRSAGLAWDPCADVLYMINDRNSLYTVTFDAGEASAELVVELETVGYPVNALVDGMGWAPPLCGADTDGNDVVNVTDLLELLSKWGPCPPSCSADVDCNGVVNVTDLLALLGTWGPCGP